MLALAVGVVTPSVEEPVGAHAATRFRPTGPMTCPLMLQLAAVAVRIATGPTRSSKPENGPQESVPPVGLVPDTVRALTVATSCTRLVHGPSFSVPATETSPTYAAATGAVLVPTVTAADTAAFKLAGPEKQPANAHGGIPVEGAPTV